MSIIPYVMTAVDGNSRSFRWTGLSQGDIGQPAEVWGWPSMVWHLTGHVTVNTDNAPIWILGSNDQTCFVPLQQLIQPSNLDDPPEYVGAGPAVSHNFTDAGYDGSQLPRYQWMAPRRRRCTGTHIDLSVYLFCSRQFPPIYLPPPP